MQVKQRVLALRGGQSDDLAARTVSHQSIFVAVGLDGTEIRPKCPGTGEYRIRRKNTSYAVTAGNDRFSDFLAAASGIKPIRESRGFGAISMLVAHSADRRNV